MEKMSRHTKEEFDEAMQEKLREEMADLEEDVSPIDDEDESLNAEAYDIGVYEERQGLRIESLEALEDMKEAERDYLESEQESKVLFKVFQDAVEKDKKLHKDACLNLLKYEWTGVSTLLEDKVLLREKIDMLSLQPTSILSILDFDIFSKGEEIKSWNRKGRENYKMNDWLNELRDSSFAHSKYLRRLLHNELMTLTLDEELAIFITNELNVL